MFKREPIIEKIESLAEKAFAQGFTQDAIKRFLAEVKSYAYDAIESELSSHARNEAFQSDINKDAFLDFSTGYVAQMRQWLKEHPVEIKPVELSIDEVCDKAEISKKEKDIFIKHLLAAGLVTAGVVTVLTIGFTCFDPSFNVRKILVVASILVEVASLVFTYQHYKAEKEETNAEMVKIRESRLKMQIAARKRKLIGGIVEDFGNWFDAAEAESERVVKTFKL